MSALSCQHAFSWHPEQVSLRLRWLHCTNHLDVGWRHTGCQL